MSVDMMCARLHRRGFSWVHFLPFPDWKWQFVYFQNRGPMERAAASQTTYTFFPTTIITQPTNLTYHLVPCSRLENRDFAQMNASRASHAQFLPIL